MVEWDLENFRLISGKSLRLQQLVQLMELEMTYINQIYKLLSGLLHEPRIIEHSGFGEFLQQYYLMAQHHFAGIGFSKALDMVQIYHYAFLENLMDDHVLAAAEHLEEAIRQLEAVMNDFGLQHNAQLVLISQSFNMAEEVQFKIIEGMDQLLTLLRHEQVYH